MTPTDRRELRRVLSERYPFIHDPDVGPSTVAAGECDRCGREPRAVTTCGPTTWEAICVGCAGDVGDEGWCDGHREDGRAWRDRTAAWPREHPTVTRLWWVATGEVALDPALLEQHLAALPGRPTGWAGSDR